MKKYLSLIAIISLISCSTPDIETPIQPTPEEPFVSTGYVVESYPEARAWGYDGRTVNGIFSSNTELLIPISIVSNSGNAIIKYNNEVFDCDKSYRSYYFYENNLNSDTKIYHLFYSNDRIIGILRNKLTNKFYIYFPQTNNFIESINAPKYLITE